MPSGNKKVTRTCVTFLLPPGIKGLKSISHRYSPFIPPENKKPFVFYFFGEDKKGALF